MNNEQIIEMMMNALDRGETKNVPEELRLALENNQEMQKLWEELTETEILLPMAMKQTEQDFPVNLHDKIMDSVESAQLSGAAQSRRSIAPLWLPMAAAAALLLVVSSTFFPGNPAHEENTAPQPVKNEAQQLSNIHFEFPKITLNESFTSQANTADGARREIIQTAQLYFDHATSVFDKMDLENREIPQKEIN